MQDIPLIPAKSMVIRTKDSGWFGADYNMNIYRGCSHGCIYCDSRSECYGNTEFDTVKAKQDALALIRQDLMAKRQKGVVATGAMSDPYNPREAQLGLTRAALVLLARYGFGVSIDTKSDLVLRDIDRLQEIGAHAPVLVKITITTPEETLAGIIEPHAPPSSRRFAALGQLSAAGLFCGALLMPTLPFITDEPAQVMELVRRVAEQGGNFVYPSFGVTLRDIQREHYYTQLDSHFPGLRRRYQQQYGSQYACGSPRAKELWAAFQEACRAHGILYKMKDIIAGYRGGYGSAQTSLFDS